MTISKCLNEPPTYLSREIVSGERSGERTFSFPVRSVQELPFCCEDFADIEGEVLADDRHRYLVKGVRGGKYVPASEWVAAHLADLLNLPVPIPKIVETFDGKLIFGSRRIATTADKVTTAAILTSNTLLPTGSLMPGLSSVLAQAYAFDLFVNNTDRNEGNFLCCTADGSYRLYLIDHARSLFSRKLDAFPPSSGYGTIFVARNIRMRHGFDMAAALRLIDKIERLAPEPIVRIIGSTPDEWLTPPEKEEFIDWWNNGKRQMRLQKLRDGLNDGSLL